MIPGRNSDSREFLIDADGAKLVGTLIVPSSVRGLVLLGCSWFERRKEMSKKMAVKKAKKPPARTRKEASAKKPASVPVCLAAE